MSNDEKAKFLVEEIIKIEKEAMQKKFAISSGMDPRYTQNRADTEVVQKILSLLDKEVKDL